MEASAADKKLTLVIVSQIILSWIILGVVLILENSSSQYQVATGWIAVVGASITFGATGIPMKYESLQSAQVDPSVFSLYTALGLFIVCFPFLIYLVVIKSFVFLSYGILGATFIALIGYFSYIAVQHSGYAKAPAIWASIGMITAYIWGLCYFKEKSKDVLLSSLSIAFLAVGVICITTSQGGDKVEQPTGQAIQTTNNINEPSSTHIASLNSSFNYVKADHSIEVVSSSQSPMAMSPELAALDHEESSQRDETLSTSQLSSPTKPTLHPYYTLLLTCFGIVYGYIFCLLTGLLDGSLMLPFKLTNPTDLTATLQYIVSFGIGALIVSPIMFAIYTHGFRSTDLRPEEMRVAFFPGLTSGTLWATANFMSVKVYYYYIYMYILLFFAQFIMCLLVCNVFYIGDVLLRHEGRLPLDSDLYTHSCDVGYIIL